MKRNILRIYICLLLFGALIATVMHLYLPSEISIIEGKEHIFKFNLPINAEINSPKKGVMVVNNQKVNENQIKVDLNKPLSLQVLDSDSNQIEFNFFGIPIKRAKIDTIPDTKLVPIGKLMGIRIFTDGVLVLGTGYVNGADGKIHEPSKDILKTGDLILEINGKDIKDKEKLISVLQKNVAEDLHMKINRNGQILEETVTPVKSTENGEYKIGIWVRDSTQGIGTLTYYNPRTGYYGALGHGIQDVDTNELMKIRDGKILKSEITCIKKGGKGVPGELMGIIIDTFNDTYGDIMKNTNYGIFGKLKNKKILAEDEEIQIGLKEEIKPGKAYIYSDVLGNKVDKYEIEIQNINTLNYEVSKGMIVKIVDPKLLEATNGIIQGMSGSPIIQNGKFIGAITHVFVSDPSRGYAIFIENMLKEEKKI